MSNTRDGEQVVDNALEHPTHDNASSSAPITNSDAPRHNIFTNHSAVIDPPLDEVFRVLRCNRVSESASQDYSQALRYRSLP
ncbi:hypothetical protein PHLCEN_2v4427 [Hermanssonia centrifuga]|uniref:Uncharacterized protein n=1 Tax=Hermanssonia centrifuga TaxID=98765 RepID=A0A2R6PNU2_9APHY|nr:hypothetical protein PHLCEN_2v4427 [Hermanssonia centrifuga]